MHASFKSFRWLPVFAIGLALLTAACGKAPAPADTTATDVRWASLGERLFNDKSLSSDGRTSCASCHRPDRAFTDALATSVGAHGRTGTRNAPSLLDVAELPQFFWDGRESSLETVVLQPLTNPVEMDLASTEELVRRLERSPQYAEAFKPLGGVSGESVAKALVAYLRTLRSGDSAYDRFVAGDRNALGPDEQAGLALFTGKAACNECHVLQTPRARLTDDRFHHLGVNDDAIAGKVATLIPRIADRKQLGRIVLTEANVAGLGHFVASRQPADLAAFRTPSLRNVVLTAPYMHDGSVATLHEAVEQEIYYRGLNKGRPIPLAVRESQQLLAFLHSLSQPTSPRSTIN